MTCLWTPRPRFSFHRPFLCHRHCCCSMSCRAHRWRWWVIQTLDRQCFSLGASQILIGIRTLGAIGTVIGNSVGTSARVVRVVALLGALATLPTRLVSCTHPSWPYLSCLLLSQPRSLSLDNCCPIFLPCLNTRLLQQQPIYA